MTQPRKTIVSLADTPYYHCVSRCVRRAFLCGYDNYSNQDYEHRRKWLEDMLHRTAEVFAIKLCAYAVMSNHYHVVLHVRKDIADEWTNKEVVRRWHQLFSGTLFSQKFALGEILSAPQRERLQQDIDTWRERLTNISWFMKIVNESIARRANAEDNCTGHFWESRFKSQALLDERALLSCMAYVDLNPVRAKMAQTPETSDYTCIMLRSKCLAENRQEPNTLENCIGSDPESIGLPFRLIDYLELVDWTGRVIRGDKRGSLHQALPPILQRLSLDEYAWKTLTTEFERQFGSWVGSEHIVRQVCSDRRYQRIPSTRSGLRLLN